MKKSYIKKLEGKEWKECIDKAFNKIKKDLNLDGFRKGQVPFDVYCKKVGIEALFMDAADFAIEKSYEELMKDKETITPVVQPNVNIKTIDKDQIVLEFEVIGMPEVELGKYKELGIKKETAEVSEEEIEHELEHVRNDFAEIRILDDEEVVSEGRIAVIDFEGFVDGKPFDGGKSKNYPLTIGSHSFIQGFEEGLVGLKKGEEEELNLKFPEDYHSEELKGKDVVFKVKINEIKERVLPEMDADFFKDLGLEGVDTVEKLKEEIKENLKASKEAEIEDKYTYECLDKVVENAKFEVPEEMIEEEVSRITREFEEQISMQGFTLDNYLKMTNSKLEDLREMMKPEAEKRVKYRVVIDAVAKEEKIEVTEKEVNEEVKKLAEKYNTTEEEFLKNIGSSDLIKYDLEMRKAIELITK